MKTPDPEIFIRAADMIDSCYCVSASVAIEEAAGTHQRRRFEESKEGRLFRSLFLNHSDQLLTSRSHRIFALLLAAEIAKEGGL